MTPKIIHQVWVGPNPIPENEQLWIQGWKDHNPTWEHRLWTDKEVESEKLVNTYAYSTATSYSERSDVLRYELIYKYGGLYLDTDFKCLRSLDALCLEDLDCFAPHVHKEGACFKDIESSVLGGRAGHPLLEALVADLEQSSRDKGQHVVARTGPGYFRRHLTKECGLYCLPSETFFPYHWIGKEHFNRMTIKELATIFPDSYGAHAWNCSWKGKKGSIPG